VPLNRIWKVCAVGMLLIPLHSVALLIAMQPGAVPEEYADLVPQYLLGLIHSGEVQKELGLTEVQLEGLEDLFVKTDSHWLQSRNLPPEKQRAVISLIEQRVHQWLEENTNIKQQERLRQLELQSQSIRMLLRKDLGEQLGLKASQSEQFAELARETDGIKQKLQAANKQDQDAKQLATDAVKAARAEKKALEDVLDEKQHEKLWKLLGDPFETSKLARIYPMAPEFAAVENWINSSPLKMKELRGKVVLVHFYAFQCHNCHANFDIYRRWHDQLRDKGVVVVGIQTPETSRERDPAAVEAAAVERDLQFPILVDLESKNWRAWGNTMWPSVYVVDKNGYIRSWWNGELQWQGAKGDKKIEKAVNVALAEKTADF